MKKLALFLAAMLFLLVPAHAGAESGKELIENSKDFDGTTVTFQGEVIGVMIRGDNAWVNVLDNGYAIGILCSAENAKQISFTGDYTHVGDTVAVSGTFHMACPEHGGDLDIHADNLTVTARGRELDRTPSWQIVGLAAVLMAVAIFLMIWLRRRRKEIEKILPWPWSGH